MNSTDSVRRFEAISGKGVLHSMGCFTVLETLPVSVIVLETSGTVTYANAPARRLAAVIHGDPDEGLKRLSAGSPMFQGARAEDSGMRDCEDRYDCMAESGTALTVVRQWRITTDTDHISVTLRPASSDDAAGNPQDRANKDQASTFGPHDVSVKEQQTLIHAEKLATVGQLAAGMAHEINNPICYVQSNLGTLRDYMNKLFGVLELSDQLIRDHELSDADRLDALEMRKQSMGYQMIAEDLPALLEESREGVERIRQIVQNLRDFSRLDPTESFRLFDVHRAIETTLGIVRSLGGNRVRFVTYFDAVPLIECNPTELNQVFMNILVNATQAIETDGVIEIQTEATKDAIRIRITDNGCGMAPDTLARIFEPFYTTKEVGKGTGLGLSISYGIIKKHNGEITVESKVGQGTTFIINLPVRQSHIEISATS
jgi:two-component system NtrC family sensor kinase